MTYDIPCSGCKYFEEATVNSPQGENGKEILEVCILRMVRKPNDLVDLVRKKGFTVPSNCPNEYVNVCDASGPLLATPNLLVRMSDLADP
jgi:hypothetical protein